MRGRHSGAPLSHACEMFGPAQPPGDVGVRFGFTLRRIQTGGSTDIEGHISKRGDSELGTMLHEAASGMLVRSPQWSSIKAWRGAVRRSDISAQGWRDQGWRRGPHV
jgi:hypothetical protein